MKGRKYKEVQPPLAPVPPDWNDYPDFPSLDWAMPKVIDCAVQANEEITRFEKMTSVVPSYARLGTALRMMEFNDDYGEGIDSRSAWGKKHGCDDTRMSRAVAIARHFKHSAVRYLQEISLTDAMAQVNAAKVGSNKSGVVKPSQRLATIKKALDGLPDALLDKLSKSADKNEKKKLLDKWVEVYRVLLHLQNLLEDNKIISPLDSVVPETIEV